MTSLVDLSDAEISLQMSILDIDYVEVKKKYEKVKANIEFLDKFSGGLFRKCLTVANERIKYVICLESIAAASRQIQQSNHISPITKRKVKNLLLFDIHSSAEYQYKRFRSFE